MDVTLITREAGNDWPPRPPGVRQRTDTGRPVGAGRPARHGSGADLAAPPVVLPDFHHKSNMELPSSVAVATRSSIRPTLTSASVNCGMALIALNSDAPGRGRDRGVLPARPRALSVPAGPGAPSCPPRDVLAARSRAARSRRRPIRRRGIDPRTASKSPGRIDLDRYGGADRLRRELPGLVLHLARLRFGMVGPSNHFIELQEVEEVFDPQTAAELGVAAGQLTLQYHAGGGVLPGAIGAMFGRRKHYPKQIRAAMSVVKPLYHGMAGPLTGAAQAARTSSTSPAAARRSRWTATRAGG